MWLAISVLMLAFQASPSPMSDAEIEAFVGRLAAPRQAPSIVAPHLADSPPTPSSPAAGASSEMFDLICTGRMETTARRPTPLADLRFRIDLTTKRYCVGPCREMMALTVYPATLVFFQMDEMMNGTRMQARQSMIVTLARSISQASETGGFLGRKPANAQSLHILAKSVENGCSSAIQVGRYVISPPFRPQCASRSHFPAALMFSIRSHYGCSGLQR